MVNKKIGVGIGVVVLLVILSFYVDTIIVEGFSKIRVEALTSFFSFIELISSEVIIFIFLSVLFLWNKSERRWVIPLWLAMSLSVVTSFVLKISVHRIRPFQLGIISLVGSAIKSNYLTWNYSFPSFQTMLIFCTVPFLSARFPKLKSFWIVFAILIGLSRIYFGVHFPSDVLVGGLIGLLMGSLVMKFADKKFNLSKSHL